MSPASYLTAPPRVAASIVPPLARKLDSKSRAGRGTARRGDAERGEAQPTFRMTVFSSVSVSSEKRPACSTPRRGVDCAPAREKAGLEKPCRAGRGAPRRRRPRGSSADVQDDGLQLGKRLEREATADAPDAAPRAGPPAERQVALP